MIEYKKNGTITPGQFVDILNRSGLAERRPVDDATLFTLFENPECLQIQIW